MLETNIDNMNGEVYSFIYSKLFAEGALDVFTTAIIMKKNRPANILSVLCEEINVEKIEKIIFMETTTLGIRKCKVERDELKREIIKVKTKYGDVSVKAAYMDGEIIKYAPEYEECAEIADKNGIPLSRVYMDVVKEAEKEI